MAPSMKYCKLLLVQLLCSSMFVFSSAQYQDDQELSYGDMLQLCEGHNIKAISYPGNESQYIICNYDTPVIGSCNMYGYCFNAEKQNCSAICSPNYTQNVTAYCRDQGMAMMTFLPANDCEHYYICMGFEEAIYGTCPNGLHFSRKYNQCMWPIDADCPLQHKTCESKPDGFRYGASVCYQYYECRNRQVDLMTCKYGEYYDNARAVCISDSRSVCLKSSQRLPVCTPADDGKRYSHAKCYKYYICISSIPYEAQCASNQYFDEITAKCEYGSC